MAGFLDLQFAAYDLTRASGAFSLLLTALVVGVLVHFSAKAVVKKDNLWQGLAAGAYAVLAGILVRSLVKDGQELFAFVLALIAFILVILAVYRVKAGQAAAVGAVAWVLWIVTMYTLSYIVGHWRA